MKTTQFRIGYTDVILNDFELGQGKIIISDDDYGYNFSYYWGAMGATHTLSTFIQKLNTGYFVGKLSPYSKGDIDMKKTMRNVRKWWKDESGIKWYEYLDAQKELRYAFKQIEEYTGSEERFVNQMQDIRKEVDCVLFDRSGQYKYFKSALEALECEPWHFIENLEHDQNRFLRLFLPKLQSYLKKANP